MYFFLSYITHHRFGVLLFAITDIEIKMMIVRVSVHKKILLGSIRVYVQYRNMVKSDSFFFFFTNITLLSCEQGNLEREIQILNFLVWSLLDYHVHKIKEREFQKMYLSFKTLFLHILWSSPQKSGNSCNIFPFESKSKLLVWNLFHSWHCIVFVIESKHQKVKKTISHNLT